MEEKRERQKMMLNWRKEMIFALTDRNTREWGEKGEGRGLPSPTFLPEDSLYLNTYLTDARHQSMSQVNCSFSLKARVVCPALESPSYRLEQLMGHLQAAREISIATMGQTLNRQVHRQTDKPTKRFSRKHAYSNIRRRRDKSSGKRRLLSASAGLTEAESYRKWTNAFNTCGVSEKEDTLYGHSINFK
ncbi:hypothetical protein RRG08_049982 [Elysia crispata]|uniref:Uncharacterized protein n=1 Tax=Elysia crispata TaxID=231223 RepID=A0AAE1BBD5_9GAST|nr:hypothetical protein RRG08_049982 [Elysia crispata]